jgi:DNA processing protein
MFIQLTVDESKIIDILSTQDVSGIDEINFKSSLSTSAVASALLNLELQGLVISLPGKMYKLLRT